MTRRTFLPAWVVGALLGLSVLLASVSSADAQTFILRGVTFDESAYLSEEELQSTVAPYLNRAIGFDDLTQMMAAIQSRYESAGIVTAQALLPPQTLENGVLRVSLVEARIGTVEVDGLERTNPEFLRKTISLEEGTRPDFVEIEKDLRIYEVAHDIAPQISFRPGADPGTTTATITGEETEPFIATMSLDNFGRDETGKYRLTYFGRITSLTGVRDSLSFQLQGIKEASSALVGYSRPIGYGGGRVNLSLSYSEASITTDPTNGVTVLSTTRSGVLSYNQPFAVKAASHWTYSVGIGVERSESRVDGTRFADVTLNDVFANVGYLYRGPERTFSFNVGLRSGQADALGRSLTEGDFTVLTGGFSYATAFGEGVLFDATLAAQVALTDALPTARQFSAGGVQTVRGYPINIQTGDSGVTLRLQLTKLNAYVSKSKMWRVSPFGFVDAAFIQPHRAPGASLPRDETMASIGAGLRYRHRNGLSGVMFVGIPLSNTTNFKNKGDPQFFAGLDFRF